MLDPLDVDVRHLCAGDVELELLERWSLDDGAAPPGYLFAIVMGSPPVELGQLLIRLDAAASEFAGHVAYEIAPEHRGHGYAHQACLAVAPLLRMHVDAAWIMIAPDNLASLRTAERLGAVYVDTRAIPEGSDMRALGIEQVRRYRWVP